MPRRMCGLLLWVVVLASSTGSLADDGDSEVREELVFIESHRDGELGIDGLSSSYALVTSQDGKHVYVSSMTDHSVSVFSRDAATGELTFEKIHKNGEDGIDGLRGARSLVLSPDGKYLYVVSLLDDALVAFSRNVNTGLLQYLENVKDDIDGIDGLDGARALAVSPDGINLYVGGFDDDAIAIFQRDVNTGLVSFLGRLKQGENGASGLNSPHYIDVSPDGDGVYLVSWDDDSISCFLRDASTGLLTYKHDYADGIDGVDKMKGPRAIAFSPEGDFVYVATWNDDSVVTFSRDRSTSELTYVNAVVNNEGEVEGIDGAHSLEVSIDGKFVYVAAFFDDALTVFRRNDETGTLSYDQSIENGVDGVDGLNGALIVNASSDGEHVYLSASSDQTLVAFSRELIIDPPVIVVDPESKSVPLGELATFSGVAEGLEVVYRWQADGVDLPGEFATVLSLDAVDEALDGTEYTLVATNDGGTATSEPARLTVLPPITLEKPVSLTSLTLSSTTSELKWVDQSDNEVGFEIHRRESDGEFATIAQVFANTVHYEDSELEASTVYIYRVRATRNFEISEWSNESVVESFDNAPNSPADLEVVETSYHTVRLNWSDLSAVEEGYYIERADGELGAVWTTIGETEKSVSTYSDRSVVGGATYSYRVSAYNESGRSEYSNTAVSLTQDNPVTFIDPVNREASSMSTSGHIVLVESTLEWEAFSDSDWLVVTRPASGEASGNQSVSYSIEENPATSIRTGTINIGGLLHTVTQQGSEPYLDFSPSSLIFKPFGGLADVIVSSNVDWTAVVDETWLRIKAGASGSGNGRITFEADAYAGAPDRVAEVLLDERSYLARQQGQLSYLEPPINITTDASGGEGVLVQWEDVSDNEDGFIIDRSEAGLENWEEIARVPANATSFLDTSAEPGTDYEYRVRSYNAEEESTNVDSSAVAVPVSRLVNMSSRAHVGTGHNVMIAGFVLEGGPRSRVLTRAVGPSLESFNLPSFLADPIISVRRPSDPIEAADYVFNDNWTDSYTAEELLEFEKSTGGFSLVGSELNSVIEKSYESGPYTSIVFGNGGVEGIALVELYSLDKDSLDVARPVNLSTRARVGLKDDIIIGGFVIEGDAPLPVLIRGIGPSLSRHGVEGFLQDPVLSLYDGEDIIAQNDNWGVENADALSDAFSRTGAFALSENSKDAALLVVLEPGVYTCFLQGVAGTTGIALWEVYVAR